MYMAFVADRSSNSRHLYVLLLDTYCWDGRPAAHSCRLPTGRRASNVALRTERISPGSLPQKVNPTSNLTARCVTKCVPLKVERKL